MKYIVIGYTLAGCLKKEVMVVFPEELVHSMVYDALLKGGCVPGTDHTAISAGTIVRGRCNGYSQSLNVQSRQDEDSFLFGRGGAT